MAWFRLGKVAGETHAAIKDEDVVRVLEESIGTSDLDEKDLNPLMRMGGMESYVIRNQKYGAVRMSQGIPVGTKGFVETFEAAVLQYMFKEMGKAFSEETK